MLPLFLLTRLALLSCGLMGEFISVLVDVANRHRYSRKGFRAKKGQMTEMLAKELQTGLNFLMWPDLIAKGCLNTQTLSEFLLTVVRLKPENKDVTADHAMFRKVREGSFTEDDVATFFRRYNFDINSEQQPISEIGAWPIIQQLLKREIDFVNCSELQPKQKETNLQLLTFLSALCDVDKDFITECRRHAPKINHELINTAFREWLLIECDFQNWNSSQEAELMVAIVLNMAALFYLFVRNKFPDEEGQLTYKSIVPRILPEVVTSRGQLTFLNANHKLIDIFKTAWEKSQFRYGDKTTWHAFYQDLARAEHLSCEWYLDEKRKMPTELIDPDVSKIKKRIERIKNGFSVGNIKKSHLITTADLRWLIKPVAPQSYEQQDESMLEFFLVGIMELVQLELLNKGIAPNTICELFARYPLYLESLERRYAQFCFTGKVAHQFNHNPTSGDTGSQGRVNE